MKKLLHGTLIRTDPHETGKGDTYQAKVYGGVFAPVHYITDVRR